MSNESLLNKLLKLAMKLKPLIHEPFKYEQTRKEYRRLKALVLERMEKKR